jgi:hypothetical protein
MWVGWLVGGMQVGGALSEWPNTAFDESGSRIGMNKKSKLSLMGIYIYPFNTTKNTRSAKPKAATQSVFLSLASPKVKIEKHHYMHAMHHALCDPAFFFSLSS